MGVNMRMKILEKQMERREESRGCDRGECKCMDTKCLRTGETRRTSRNSQYLTEGKSI